MRARLRPPDRGLLPVRRPCRRGGEASAPTRRPQWEGFLSGNHVDKALAIGIGTRHRRRRSRSGRRGYRTADPHNPIIRHPAAQLIPRLAPRSPIPSPAHVIRNDDFGATARATSARRAAVDQDRRRDHSFDARKSSTCQRDGDRRRRAGGTYPPRGCSSSFRQRKLTPTRHPTSRPPSPKFRLHDRRRRWRPGHGDPACRVNTEQRLSVADPSVIFGTDAAGATTKASPAARATTSMSGGAGDDNRQRRRWLTTTSRAAPE